MGGPALRRVIAPAAILAVLVACAASSAAVIPKPVQPVYSGTGDNAELLKRIPIARKAGVRDRVAMRLDPTTFDPIAAGDVLTASGEVQVSTTCVDPGPRCVGRSYDMNPTVTAQIVLSGSPKAGGAVLPLSAPQSVLCKQRRPNRNHHCTIAVPNTQTTITDPATLPCAASACYLEMVVGAVNRKAKGGDVVVLGADRPDGSVAQDKGRLNLVQAHSNVAAPTTTATNQLVNTELPLTIHDSEKRRTVYSIPIVAPQKGEVLTFDTAFLTGISALRFNTFISSRVIIAQSPTDTKPTGIAKNAIPLKGQATESNGFNCTLGPSGFANACTTVKAGAVRFSRDVVDKATGLPATVYLNVLAGAKPLLAQKVTNVDKVSLAAQPAGLSVTQYAP